MKLIKLTILTLLSFQTIFTSDKQENEKKAARKAARAKYKHCMNLCEYECAKRFSFTKGFFKFFFETKSSENLTTSHSEAPTENDFALAKYSACANKCLALYVRRLDAINKKYNK